MKPYTPESVLEEFEEKFRWITTIQSSINAKQFLREKLQQAHTEGERVGAQRIQKMIGILKDVDFPKGTTVQSILSSLERDIAARTLPPNTPTT